jgi:Flp pilus assembly protein TadD
MRHVRRVFPVLCAALLSLISSTAVAQVGRVSGVAKDDSGQPLKGATITAENPNIGQTFTATTDDKGRFQIIGLRGGEWRFIAQAPGFTPEIGSMPVRMGSVNPPITFVMKRGGPTAFGALGGITGKDLQEDLTDAEALFTQQKWDEAISAYREILGKSAALSIVNLQIASAYRGKKDYDGALTAYNDLLKVDGDNAKAILGIVATNVERGDTRAAETALLKAAESQTADREIYYGLGDMKLAQNANADAETWYRKAAAADPSWGKPFYKLGLVAMKKGDQSAAGQLMTKVIEVDPTSPEAGLAKTTLESLKK